MLCFFLSFRAIDVKGRERDTIRMNLYVMCSRARTHLWLCYRRSDGNARCLEVAAATGSVGEGVTMASTVKRSRRKQARTYESASFSQSAMGQPGDGPPVVVLSSNFSIGPLLARGALLPEAWEGEAISAGAAAGRLRWSQGALPAAWVAALVESARNVIPIAIRLRPGRQVRELAIPGYVGTIDGICSADVAGLFFRTEKEHVRFESLEFSNYDLAAVDTSFGVDASLFDAKVNEGSDSTTVNPPRAVPTPGATAESGGQLAATASPDDGIQAVRSADCMTGLLAFLSTASPGTRAWMQGVQRLFTSKTKGLAASWPERLANEALGKPIDAFCG